MTATPELVPEPAGDEIEPETLSDAEQAALELRRKQIAADLPEGMEVDDQLNIVISDGYEQCPLCSGLGVRKRSFNQSPLHMGCPDCSSLGEVSTGSLVVGSEVLMCETCQMKGYLLISDWERIERERAEAKRAGP